MLVITTYVIAFLLSAYLAGCGAVFAAVLVAGVALAVLVRAHVRLARGRTRTLAR